VLRKVVLLLPCLNLDSSAALLLLLLLLLQMRVTALSALCSTSHPPCGCARCSCQQQRKVRQLSSTTQYNKTHLRG
jgi:hypothetical protein